ncbi:hypothetical protein E2C01_018174 [Portunus trituberculatus]|uniref:Uncharacterized protein n=1 Tax=Portunus trituberculatus TaxID=210409 RepID=A0A5B7DVQ2_PORTR|nr:hypothetical protein [Portunus trituberculatus]
MIVRPVVCHSQCQCHMPGTYLYLTVRLVHRLLADIKVFKCKILGSNNDLNSCESLNVR